MTVIVSDWEKGFNKVQFNDLLRHYAGFSLGEAKKAVDRLLDHEPLKIEIADEISAGEFLRRVNEIGVITSAPIPRARSYDPIVENTDERANNHINLHK